MWLGVLGSDGCADLVFSFLVQVRGFLPDFDHCDPAGQGFLEVTVKGVMLMSINL